MSNLRNKIAARVMAKKAQQKVAKQNVASAWVIAKTMLPTAPAEAQYRLASSLLSCGNKILASALKQSAINANYTKIAETLKEVHKVDLNDLMEDEATLTKLQNELAKELKKASAKKADGEEEAPEAEAAPEAEDATEVPADDANTVDMPETGDQEAVIPAEEKVELHNKIDKAEDAISELEKEIMDAEESELNIAAAFSDETAGKKVMNLAHEEDVHDEQFEVDVDWDDDSQMIADPAADEETQDEDGFFGPSAVENMEASMETSDAAQFFQDKAASEVDPLGNLMRRASEVVKPGELVDEFESSFSDDRDFETDHEDNILFEVAMGIESPEHDDDRDSQPEMQKAAAKKLPKEKADILTPKTKSRGADGKSVRTLDVASKTASRNSEADMIARALFGDDV